MSTVRYALRYAPVMSARTMRKVNTYAVGEHTSPSHVPDDTAFGAVAYRSATDALVHKTRLVPDFPEPGVLFEDLTPVLADPQAFHLVVDELAAAARAFGADAIGGLDARGFLLGSAVAYNLGVGIVAIRKKGKLPPPVYTESYSLEYGSAALQVPAEGIDIAGKRIVLVDDVLATGGTLNAARTLVENHLGATVTGYAVVLEVPGLGGRSRLGDVPLTVVKNSAD